MATTASQRRSPTRRQRAASNGSGRKAVKPGPAAGGKAVKPGTAASSKAPAQRRKAGSALFRPTAPSGGGVSSALVRMAARKAGRALLRKAASTGAAAMRSATGAAVAGTEAVGAKLAPLGGEVMRRVPIQVSVDVAVPISVAWEEWTRLESLTEGVHEIADVERDGETLSGTIGRAGREWEAEITDERPQESFAWRSVTGSDCAGLVTFHELSDRLTRIEVDLDIVPVGPAQSIAFLTRMADRRARADLRRFKARVEFISPDAYDADEDEDEDEPDEE